MAKPDRLERLTDLVLVLLAANRPLTLDALADEVPGYPSDHGARRQAFERDKRVLRDEGIPVATEPVEGQEQFGYRIHPEAFYLPDLHLDPAEQVALHLAVAGVHLGDPSGRHALLKLGATGLAESRPVASLDPPRALVPLFEGLRSHAEVTFNYRGGGRQVAPAALAFRAGRWYLVGWDRQRGAVRTFRADRIEEGPDLGPPGSGELPADFDLGDAVPDDPWRAGEGEGDDIFLWVDPIEASRLTEEVGEQAVVERRPDGSVVLRLGTTSADAFRSWVLGLLDHAEILGPPNDRAAIVEWLEVLAARPESAPPDLPEGGLKDLPVPPTAQGASEPSASNGAETPGSGDGAGGAVAASGRHDASFRLRRLLAIVGWLARVGEATIAEVSRRFGIPEDELVRELELAACCGLPPYSPDVLMEIVVTDQVVSAMLPPDLARPRRLTAAEGLALLAAGRTILSVPGADEEGTLAGALTKLEAVLGEQGRVLVALDTPPFLSEVRQFAEDRRQIEIEYHSASSDETTRRVVDPLQVLSLDGHWYLDGFCYSAQGNRRFRVDRIRSLAPSGRPSERHASAPPTPDAEAFVPGPGAVLVRLVVEEPASWIVDSVPVVEVRDAGAGRQLVTLAVGGTAWLERLLLQLGPHARVVEPLDLADLGATAARRILGRYGR